LADGHQFLGHGVRSEIFSAHAEKRTAGAHRESFECVWTHRPCRTDSLCSEQVCGARIYGGVAPRACGKQRVRELRASQRNSDAHYEALAAGRDNSTGEARREYRAI